MTQTPETMPRHAVNTGGADSPILLRSLCLKNFLSFGPDSPEIKLGPLNLLIGANGSGKSNLIEAVSLLRSSAASLTDTLRKGGGVAEWIWKGNPGEAAHLDAVIANDLSPMPLRHIIEFQAENRGFRLVDEDVENERPDIGKDIPYFYYRYQNGSPAMNVKGHRRNLARGTVEPDKSILAQRRDPELYPEITYLADRYGKIQAYRE